eukprot:GEMP01027985.1.p1 GENE.GEMP01027985.1~~GEMP01027985.1.p1  ORF type:complete len:476 (+),score=117.26 GEMP01027985.1:106-1533(+)
MACVIVDPYSSGRYLIEELQVQCIPIVSIQSSLDLPEFWLVQFDSAPFVKNIVHKDLETTVAELSAVHLPILAVFVGSEPGVLVAEQLQDALHLLGNGSDTSAQRQNKYVMQERIRTCGLRATKQIYSNSVDQVLEWQRSELKSWPMIIKPAMSSGTMGLYWCHNEADARNAFDTEQGRVSSLGYIVEEMLCQEFLDGTEYIINCMSNEGKHIVTSFWVYTKNRCDATRAIIPECSSLLDSEGKIQDILRNYVFRVLDALGTKYGPTHTEVMMLQGNEPCLVEVNSRLPGLQGPKVTELSTGFGDHELYIDVMLHGAELFKKLAARDYRYIQKKNATEVVMISNYEGILAKPLNVELVQKLASAFHVLSALKVGDRLTKTRDLMSSPGVVTMLHHSAEQIERDLQTFRKIENSGFFYELMGGEYNGERALSLDGGSTFGIVSPRVLPCTPVTDCPPYELDAIIDQLELESAINCQ